MSKQFIATSTWYKEPDERSVLALEGAAVARELGVTYVAVDGNSFSEFPRMMEERGAIVLPQEIPGMDPGRLQAYEYVHNMMHSDDVFHWTEPEKVPHIKQVEKVAEPIRKGFVMVVPNRLSLESYPPMQRKTETIAAEFASILVGEEWDEFYGPLGLSKEALEEFIAFRPEDYGLAPEAAAWLRNHVPRLIVLAKFGPNKVCTVDIDYTHPPSQTEAETGEAKYMQRRIEQLYTILPSMRKVAQQVRLI